ncbi:MAG: hypothetical protein QME64_10390, partial [bacterium]|nr:hypothetical protein [bacterium]
HGSSGYAVPSVERHTLIIVDEDAGTYLHVLELLSTGEIVTTGQKFNLGHSAEEAIGVSPDSRFVWSCATLGTGDLGVKQFAITPFGQVTETGRFINSGLVEYIKFTPNGQMLLTAGPIYRAYPDGSVESTANIGYASDYISPRGDIYLGLAGPVGVWRIDYSGFSVYNIQYVEVDGGATPWDAVYTPDGNYVAITNGGGSPADVEIYPILADGMLDTTRVQRFDLGSNLVALACSKDGQYFYVSNWNNLNIVVLRRVYTASDYYEDTGWRIYTGYRAWQMEVSPDGKYLVAHDMQRLQTFAIQDDGYLVPVGERFPFDTIFGKALHYFQFAYPAAPTEIDQSLWQLYK